jgi:hypothetical protein
MRAGNSRWTAPLALALLLAVGLTACSDDKKTTESSGSTTTEAVKGSPTMSVTMAEYAYTVSGPLTAGGTIKIANKGKEFHMMGLGLLKPGKTLADFQTALQNASGPPGPGAPDPTADIVEQLGLPGNVTGPGQSSELTVPDLKAGTYAMACFIPTEGEGAPHFTKGMISQLQVVEGTAPPAPTADATYKIAPGKPIEGPATLTAGSHTLKFEAASGSEQLEPGLGKLNPGATFAEVNDALNKVFEGDQPPPKGVANQVPGQIIFGGFDLHETTTFYLRVDFTAGNYGMVADDTDVENPPNPPKELIAITVT